MSKNKKTETVDEESILSLLEKAREGIIAACELSKRALVTENFQGEIEILYKALEVDKSAKLLANSLTEFLDVVNPAYEEEEDDETTELYN